MLMTSDIITKRQTMYEDSLSTSENLFELKNYLC